MNEIDSAIISCYGQYNTPSDQISLNDEKKQEFAALVNAALRAFKIEVAPDTCAERTVYLRKRGFLPRLRRKKPR